MDMSKCSRRQMLLTGAAGLATTMATRTPTHGAETSGASGDRPDASRAGPVPHVYKISVAGYSFRGDLDRPGEPGKMSLFDLVDLARRLELDAIEPTSYYFLREDDEFIYALKRRAFLAGLEISGTPIRNNFCLPPGPALEKELAHVRKWVDHCVKLGSPAIRVFAGKPPKDGDREKAFRQAVSGTKEACAYAASKGIFLAIENHGYLTETADDVLRLLEGVGSEWFGINLDTGNFHGDPLANIAKAAPHAVTCQVKTMVRKGSSKEREPADLARIVAVLREGGYRGYLTLEYEGKDPHREVPMYLRKLQELARPR